jgi:hypothetical protein
MGIVIWWVCKHEHEHVRKIEFFGIFHWHMAQNNCITWRNILPCVQGWKNKTNERIKWMKNKIDEQKDEQNMFTTNSYVSIQKLPLHNWKVCVNQNTTYSSQINMFPLGIETLWNPTFFKPLQLVFCLNLVFQTSYVEDHSCYLKDKMDDIFFKWTKRMNKTCSQPRVMCQSKLYIFTIKRYVSIETCSSPRGMFP